MGKGGSPPPPPDYAGLAREQGQANRDTAIAQGQINNPNVIGPTGTQTVQWGLPDVGQSLASVGGFLEGTDIPAPPQFPGDRPSQSEPGWIQATRDWKVEQDAWDAWNQQYGDAARAAGWVNTSQFQDPLQATIRQTLSPEEQAIFDANQRARLGLGNLANQAIGSLEGVIGTPLDFSGLETGTIRNALMDRINEDYDTRSEEQRARLIAAGHQPGTQGYGTEMELLDGARNDAFLNAALTSRQQSIAEMLASRQVPLNEISALLSGSQVQNQFGFPGFAGNTQIAPPPIFGAGQAAANYQTDIYNANAARQASLNQGLFGLGGAGLLGAGLFFSDRRLKKNIHRIGTHHRGFGLYHYQIFGRPEIGVMADEVASIMPDAVTQHPSGYFMVDYRKVN